MQLVMGRTAFVTKEDFTFDALAKFGKPVLAIAVRFRSLEPVPLPARRKIKIEPSVSDVAATNPPLDLVAAAPPPEPEEDNQVTVQRRRRRLFNDDDATHISATPSHSDG